MNEKRAVDDEVRGACTVRVALPGHLQRLAGFSGEARIPVEPPVTVGALLDALELHYPMLRGAIRDHDAGPRRPYVRYFACSTDFSLDPDDTPLPDAVVAGSEPFLVVGSISGG